MRQPTATQGDPILGTGAGASRARLAFAVLLLAGLLGCRSPARPLDEGRPVVAVSEHVAPAPAAAMKSDHGTPAPIPDRITTSAGRIALDAARVYWIEAHENEGSRLLSAAKDGGDPIVLATTPTPASHGIAVDDAFVYLGYAGREVVIPWPCPQGALCRPPRRNHEPTGAILAVPKSGGPPRVIASDAREPGDIGVDGQHVYWADSADLFRAHRTGGPRVVLLSGAGCRALALDATHVYCLGFDLGVFRIPKVGGAKEILVERRAETLAMGPATIYFGSSFEVRRSEPRKERLCDKVQSAMCVEPDPMIDRVPMLATAPKTGGAPSLLVHDTIAEHVVLDGGRAYWVAGGLLMGVDLAGGAPIQIASVGLEPHTDGLAVDESRLYWVSRDGRMQSAIK